MVIVPPIGAHLIHPGLAARGFAEGLLDRRVDEDAFDLRLLGRRLEIPACAGVQCAVTERPSSLTMSTADMDSRSSLESVRSGIGVSQTSASRPT